jgi:tRNA modification GTPase
VSVLTPPGSGAIATVEVAGPRAWETARRLFRPAAKKPLPQAPPLHRFWFGTLGEGVGDEVVLAVREVEPEPRIEVHCHGGRRVVRWVVELLEKQAACGLAIPVAKPQAALMRAPTLRTASILLDQYHGAFDRAVRAILDSPDLAGLRDLARFAPVGRHLVEPWKVVIAGPPNVGKSSLVNALAGYQRAVVSEIAGTTRDVVTVPVAFDGWPVELADTAGLRRAAGLEAAGIDRAERWICEADLVVWVLDVAAGEPVLPDIDAPRMIVVINKVDQAAGWDLGRFPNALRVSAATGEGIPGLAAAIARTLAPDPPPPGAAVPYSPALADRVEAAYEAFESGQVAEAARFLRDCPQPAG